MALSVLAGLITCNAHSHALGILGVPFWVTRPCLVRGFKHHLLNQFWKPWSWQRASKFGPLGFGLAEFSGASCADAIVHAGGRQSWVTPRGGQGLFKPARTARSKTLQVWCPR